MVVSAAERTLVAAARDGDVAAFEQLVREHQLAVYRVALRIVGSAADAEDVAQESFVQAWRSLGRFRGDSSVATWLYRIATNRALDLLARRVPEPAADVGDRPALAGADPADVHAGRERLGRVMAGLQRLEPEARALLVLRELEGLSYDQIATVLSIPRSTLKGRMHRARVRLVAAMEAQA